MIRVISDGEYSDYQIHAILDCPDDWDLEAMFREYRQQFAITNPHQPDRPYYPDSIYSCSTHAAVLAEMKRLGMEFPKGESYGSKFEFCEIFAKHLIVDCGAKEVVYDELRTPLEDD